MLGLWGQGRAAATSARSLDWTAEGNEEDASPHRKVIASAVGNFGKGVGRARGDEHDVRPSAKFDVEDWVTNLVVWLQRIRSWTAGMNSDWECVHPTHLHPPKRLRRSPLSFRRQRKSRRALWRRFES